MDALSEYLEASAILLWGEMWPEVPWREASEQDKRLFRDHAHSLYIYDGS